MAAWFSRLLAGLLALGHLVVPASTDYTRMIDRVTASVVRITVVDEQRQEMITCTGFVLKPGHVLTANHCVDGGVVLADGHPTTVIKTDDYYDLAWLATPTSKPVLLLLDRPLSRFETVTSIGYAFGWSRPLVLDHTIVLIHQEPYRGAAPGLIVREGYRPGMSGGPVVNYQGLVVGIVQQSSNGVGYGVGVLLIHAFLLGLEASPR